MFQLPPLGRLRSLVVLAIMILVAVCGYISARLWPVLIAAGVLILYVSDRGQHRALVDHVPGNWRAYAALLSVGGHLLNNVLFCALTFGMGRLSWLFWIDVVDGRPGAWGDVAVWCVFELALLGALELFWRMLKTRP